jgi:hypothetical protein
MWIKKRKWFIVSIIVLALILTVGGGVVYAQTSSAADNGTGDSFAARVAAILGIDQAQVEDAFDQARKEMREEALDSRLQKMVEEGTITQEQADQYKEWAESRPDVPAELDAQRGAGFFGGDKGFPGSGTRHFPGSGIRGEQNCPAAQPSPTTE